MDPLYTEESKERLLSENKNNYDILFTLELDKENIEHNIEIIKNQIKKNEFVIQKIEDFLKKNKSTKGKENG